jgi:hypothetical protein
MRQFHFYLKKFDLTLLIDLTHFANKIYRLSPLEKGGNEVSSRDFFGFFLSFPELIEGVKKRKL